MRGRLQFQVQSTFYPFRWNREQPYAPHFFLLVKPLWIMWYFWQCSDELIAKFFYLCSLLHHFNEHLFFVEERLDLKLTVLYNWRAYLFSFGIEYKVSDHPALVGLSCSERNVENGCTEGVTFESFWFEVLDEEEDCDDALLSVEELSKSDGH